MLTMDGCWMDGSISYHLEVCDGLQKREGLLYYSASSSKYFAETAQFYMPTRNF
jgi:hypothetical protein